MPAFLRRFRGRRAVSIDTLLAGVHTDADSVTAWSDGGYTTELPLRDLTRGRAWIASGYGVAFNPTERISGHTINRVRP